MQALYASSIPCHAQHFAAWARVQVMFSPGHAPQYKQSIPIKVTHNSKGPSITCTGSAFMLKPVLEPAVLDLGAILPRFDGQQPSQALLKLTNPTDVVMEVCMAVPLPSLLH